MLGFIVDHQKHNAVHTLRSSQSLFLLLLCNTGGFKRNYKQVLIQVQSAKVWIKSKMLPGKKVSFQSLHWQKRKASGGSDV